MFDDLLIEQEQRELLETFVEATRNVTREQRQKFHVRRPPVGATLHRVRHPGLPDGQIEVYIGNVEALNSAGLIALSYLDNYSKAFDVTPQGFQYYKHIKQTTEYPVQNVETVIRVYLSSDQFRRKYPAAYQKWTNAETILWGSDSEHQLTTIGHLCREAMQEFASELADQEKLPSSEKDKAHTVARLRAVINARSNQLGNTEKQFLEALLAYWGALNDLIQRQEHGGQREGESLVWEDARRVAFQTAIVIFEVDKSLS